MKAPPQILVATDLASRGLDLPFVSHIINFDFPKTTSDYLHRAGRAGRAGRVGYVTSLYREKDLPILEAMKESHDNLKPLAIGRSAYSVRNREELDKLAEGNSRKPVLKKSVSLGALPSNLHSSEQKYIGGQNAGERGSKSQAPSPRRNAAERVLNMKLKPRKPADTDGPVKFRPGKNWRRN